MSGGVVHRVRPQPPGTRTAVETELAYAIARVACETRPLDADAAAMAANRLVENWAVGLAAINRAPVTAARAAALAFARTGGAPVLGLANAAVDMTWAAYANATAVRELDFHDSFFGKDSSHPGDTISAVLAVAQQVGASGEAFLCGVVTAYEIQTALARGIALNTHRIDHVAHLGPAIAAGVCALLRLDTATAYHAISLAAHLSVTTRQIRKGNISTYKAAAPGQVGKTAIEAVDRAVRGETSPAPIWEGDYGIIAVLLGGPDAEVAVPLPGDGEPCRAILETYPKAYSAGYHGQAVIDLALRMRERIAIERVRKVELRSKRITHEVMGAGANDPQKWDPHASRETLDHSAMFIFARALWDGEWHHERSYDEARRHDPAFLSLWRAVTTVEDPVWNARFDDFDGLDKAHGLTAVATFDDGTTLADEILVADSHPRGAAPWSERDYRGKFETLTDGIVAPDEAARFLEHASRLMSLPAGALGALNVTALDVAAGPAGLFDRR